MKVLHDRAGMDPLTLKHLVSCEASAGSRLLALGIWGDGVPCNWDRSESAECFTMNFPGQSGEFKPLRLPLTALSRKQISEHTWFDILSVLSWSLRIAAAGVWPVARHDESAFSKADCHRAKQAGQPLGVRAALAEVRGDWKMFGEVFGFPKWNTKAGVCWRCNCRPDQVSGNTNTTQCIYVIYIYIYIYIILIPKPYTLIHMLYMLWGYQAAIKASLYNRFLHRCAMWTRAPLGARIA
jgi:hypothetical protein